GANVAIETELAAEVADDQIAQPVPIDVRQGRPRMPPRLARVDRLAVRLQANRLVEDGRVVGSRASLNQQQSPRHDGQTRNTRETRHVSSSKRCSCDVRGFPSRTASDPEPAADTPATVIEPREA